jgi:hypothetical protein
VLDLGIRFEVGEQPLHGTIDAWSAESVRVLHHTPGIDRLRILKPQFDDAFDRILAMGQKAVISARLMV